MASRKESSKVIDFTPYIKKAKLNSKKEYLYYSKRLLSLFLDDYFNVEEINTIFGIFLSSFTTSISFEKGVGKKDIFETIHLFSLFALTSYQDYSLLIKSILSFLSNI